MTATLANIQGRRVALTGDLPRLSQPEAIHRLLMLSNAVEVGVSQETQLLVIGENAEQAEIDAAILYRVPAISGAELEDLLARQSDIAHAAKRFRDAYRKGAETAEGLPEDERRGVYPAVDQDKTPTEVVQALRTPLVKGGQGRTDSEVTSRAFLAGRIFDRTILFAVLAVWAAFVCGLLK